MGRRVLPLAALLAAAVAVIAIFAVAPVLLHDWLAFGTTAAAGAPPRIDFCGRRYYPEGHTVTGLPSGSAVIDTAPSGMLVLAKVMTPAEQASYRTNVCTMEVWVQTGPHSYRPYGLSGGP